MIDYILVVFALVGLVLSLSSFFILLEIKLRLAGKLSTLFAYLVVAIFVSMILEVVSLLSATEVFKLNYLSESTAFLFLALFFLYIIGFYRLLVEITDKSLVSQKKKSIELIKNKSNKDLQTGDRQGYIDFTRSSRRVDLNKLINHIRGEN